MAAHLTGSLPNSSEVNDTYVICEFLRNRDFVATISAMMPGFYGKRWTGDWNGIASSWTFCKARTKTEQTTNSGLVPTKEPMKRIGSFTNVTSLLQSSKSQDLTYRKNDARKALPVLPIRLMFRSAVSSVNCGTFRARIQLHCEHKWGWCSLWYWSWTATAEVSLIPRRLKRNPKTTTSAIKEEWICLHYWI